ncbi:MAG: hypothetical protein AAGK09_05415 [Planctomycetota bacterium]
MLLALHRHVVSRTLVLVWTVLWLAVIAPGHQRGVLRVDGEVTAAASDPWSLLAMSDVGIRPTCYVSATRVNCPLCPTKTAPTGGGDEDPAKSCALCKLNTTLAPPPPTLLAPMPIERVWAANARPTAPIASLITPPCFGSRGPPSA